MKFTMEEPVKYLTVLFAALLASLPYTAFADADQLLREVDRNLNPESFESYRKIVNIEPDGRRKEYVLFTLKKGVDKTVALFVSPASEAGRSTLRLGENMWLHIPNVGKPIRITSMQSIIGGVFNNADILSLDYSAEYAVEKQEESDGMDLLHLKAKSKTVAYDRIRMWVNRAKRLPVKIECLTEKGLLIKTLNFRDVKDFGGGIIRPSVIETESPLYKDYRSIMIYAAIKRRVVGDEAFTLTFMPRIQSLR
jgi:outer membrane lipoprotein-sorting protein